MLSLVINATAALIFVVHGHLATTDVSALLGGNIHWRVPRGAPDPSALTLRSFASLVIVIGVITTVKLAIGPERMSTTSTKVSGVKSFSRSRTPSTTRPQRSVALGVVALSVLTFVDRAGVATHSSDLRLCRARRGRAEDLPTRIFRAHVSGPRLTSWEKSVPGPPKRFAQAMGLAFSLAALLTWLSAGWLDARWILLPLIGAASLEGFVGYLLGLHGLWLAHSRGRHPAIGLRGVRRSLRVATVAPGYHVC